MIQTKRSIRYTRGHITIIDTGGPHADMYVFNSQTAFDTVNLFDYETGKRVPDDVAEQRILDRLTYVEPE